MSKTIGSLGSIGRSLAEMDNMYALYGPLMIEAMEKSQSLDKAFVERAGRTIEFSKVEYSKQYEAGIDRVCGFDIVWIGGETP